MLSPCVDRTESPVVVNGHRMDERYELGLTLEKLKGELQAIPAEDWGTFKTAFENYKRIQARYILLGGCVL